MDANSFFISQQLRHVASRAQGAIQQVRRATSLRQIRDAGHVTVPSYLGSVTHTIPEMRQLTRACEMRAQELVNVDLAKLAAIAAQDKPVVERIDELKQAYVDLRQHQWVFLRGDHGTIYAGATRHAEQLIRSLQAQEPPP